MGTPCPSGSTPPRTRKPAGPGASFVALTARTCGPRRASPRRAGACPVVALGHELAVEVEHERVVGRDVQRQPRRLLDRGSALRKYRVSAGNECVVRLPRDARSSAAGRPPAGTPRQAKAVAQEQQGEPRAHRGQCHAPDVGHAARCGMSRSIRLHPGVLARRRAIGDRDGVDLRPRLGRLPRGLLRDPADAGPAAELGLDVVPVQVAIAQQHQAWKTRSATSLTRCSRPASPGSSPASTTSAASSTILAPIAATPPFIRPATYDVSACGSALRAAITAIRSDMIDDRVMDTGIPLRSTRPAESGSEPAPRARMFYNRITVDRRGPWEHRSIWTAACSEDGDAPCSAGEIEHEFGVPIPGRILPEAEWARTAPEAAARARPARLGGDLRPRGPGRPRPRLRQRPVHARQRAGPARPEPLRDRRPPGGDPLRHPARQPARAAQRPVRGQGRADVRLASYVGRRLRRRGPPLSSPAVPRPPAGAPRVLTPRFLADVHRALEPAGLFVVQTDNPDYWEYMTRVVPHFFEFQEQDGPWPDAPEGRTRREILARQRGLRIFRGVGTRRDDLDRRAALELAASLPEPPLPQPRALVRARPLGRNPSQSRVTSRRSSGEVEAGEARTVWPRRRSGPPRSGRRRTARRRPVRRISRCWPRHHSAHRSRRPAGNQRDDREEDRHSQHDRDSRWDGSRSRESAARCADVKYSMAGSIGLGSVERTRYRSRAMESRQGRPMRPPLDSGPRRVSPFGASSGRPSFRLRGGTRRERRDPGSWVVPAGQKIR